MPISIRPCLLVVPLVLVACGSESSTRSDVGAGGGAAVSSAGGASIDETHAGAAGELSSGGAPGAGGVTASGGMTSVAGATASPSNGGMIGTGGAVAAGGMTSTGGATGSGGVLATGGASASGAGGAMAATGGDAGTGGLSGTGGTSACECSAGACCDGCNFAAPGTLCAHNIPLSARCTNAAGTTTCPGAYTRISKTIENRFCSGASDQCDGHTAPAGTIDSPCDPGSFCHAIDAGIGAECTPGCD